MCFITVEVLLIFVPYHMLLLENVLKKEVLILKSWPDFHLACNTASVGDGDFCNLTFYTG